jgi:hypothetical protein
MLSAARTVTTTTVRFRTAPNVDVFSGALADADPNVLVTAQPWRVFRWHAGQKHYSGAYWAATEGRQLLKRVVAERDRLIKAKEIRQPRAQPGSLTGEQEFETPATWEWATMGQLVLSSDSGWSPASFLVPRPRIEVRVGDFVMSRANTARLVGRSVVVSNPPPRLMLSDKHVRLRF